MIFHNIKNLINIMIFVNIELFDNKEKNECFRFISETNVNNN